MNGWNAIRNGNRVELGLLHIDIAGHSGFQDTDRVIKNAKATFRRQVEGLVRIRHGRLFNWAGDGGAYMFLVQSGDGFNDLVLSAIHILESLPRINDEVNIREGFSDTISVRIACDVGIVVYDRDPTQISGDVVNRLFKNERLIGLTN